MRRSSSAALAGLLFLAGCNLSIDASRELEPGLARRIAQKQAELASKPGDAQIQVELGELYLEAERFFDAADTFRHEDSAGFVRLWGLGIETWSSRQASKRPSN